ncbi:MAG: hypothetical protein ACW9XA_07120 [Candidatus Nitrosopumilus sp. bin_6a]
MSKNGRPTKQEQVRLDESFRDCFVKGYDPLYAATVVGTNKRTAYKYYEKLSDEIISVQKTDYFKSVKENLEQLIQCYDHLLGELHSVLDGINEKLTDGKHTELNRSKIAVIKEIKEILNEKADLKMNLPHHLNLEDMVEERIKRYVESH